MSEFFGVILAALWWTFKFCLILTGIAMLIILLATVVFVLRNDPKNPWNEDDEEQAEAMRRYRERKEEKDRARVVRAELRQKRLRERRDGEEQHEPHSGDVIPSEEDPEGKLI